MRQPSIALLVIAAQLTLAFDDKLLASDAKPTSSELANAVEKSTVVDVKGQLLASEGEEGDEYPLAEQVEWIEKGAKEHINMLEVADVIDDDELEAARAMLEGMTFKAAEELDDEEDLHVEEKQKAVDALAKAEKQKAVDTLAKAESERQRTYGSAAEKSREWDLAQDEAEQEVRVTTKTALPAGAESDLKKSKAEGTGGAETKAAKSNKIGNEKDTAEEEKMTGVASTESLARADSKSHHSTLEKGTARQRDGSDDGEDQKEQTLAHTDLATTSQNAMLLKPQDADPPLPALSLSKAAEASVAEAVPQLKPISERRTAVRVTNAAYSWVSPLSITCAVGLVLSVVYTLWASRRESHRPVLVIDHGGIPHLTQDKPVTDEVSLKAVGWSQV